MSEQSYLPKSNITRGIWNSPLGPLGLVDRGGKLAQISFPVNAESFPFAVERTYGSAGSESLEAFAEVTKQLDEYFAGRRLIFRLPMDLDQGTPFQRRVWKALSDIPYGQTVSYKDIADTIGQPSATRAVGGANGKNPIPIVIPCHRVVATGGALGGYTPGLLAKKKLLGLEAETRAKAASHGIMIDNKRQQSRLGF